MRTLSLMMVFCIPSAAFSENGPDVLIKAKPTHRARKEKKPEWQQKIEKALEKRIHFDFVDTPLKDVVSHLIGLTGTNIVVDPAALAGDDHPVTLKVGDMKTVAALEWILRLTNLTYDYRHGALFIASPDRFEPTTVTRAYDCRGILTTGAEQALFEAVKDLIPKADWEINGTLLRFVDGRLVVRNKPPFIAPVDEFITEFIAASAKGSDEKQTPETD
ncbi:MAG: STN domain-containing protein [Planctomycetota bacterium]|jgi:hypothetical protein|nr:STN domain-containing protein [Planctomycetota bacterium]MDP7132298.1 STN domain-containing protein [Planctomycetota bacterium]MDP7248636.1 STN domain-containing protein [Planctomycetota bacterium]